MYRGSAGGDGDRRRRADSELEEKARTGTMKLVIVAALLGLVVLCVGRRAHNRGSLADSRSGEAFISRQESANFVKRHRRSNLHNQVVGTPVRDPLEPKREVCELNPSCDELADLVGIQEAYRRFYGPV